MMRRIVWIFPDKASPSGLFNVGPIRDRLLFPIMILSLLALLTGLVVRAEVEAADGCICPTIKPRCMPSSDDGCPVQCLPPEPSDYLDCCCQFTFINEYDFWYRYPQLSGPNKDFSYYTNGNFTADGGSITFTKKGGLLNTGVYNVTAPPNPIPYLDNYKYLVFADQPIELNMNNELVVEWEMEARTFNTDASPYPKVLLKCPNDDFRLAAASCNVYDPNTELFFNFLVTNDMIYAVYGRNADKRDPQEYNYAAFTFVIPLLWRKPTDVHKLKVVLNKRDNMVRWKIDATEYFRVTSVGARIDRTYMVVDMGGADDSVFPNSIQYGFGSMTMLQAYPACWRACETAPCIFPAVKEALFKTGNDAAPEQYDPAQGKPYPAVFWNSCNPAEKFRIWGQGSVSFFKRLSVYEQNCQAININRYQTVTVTVTASPSPTYPPTRR